MANQFQNRSLHAPHDFSMKLPSSSSSSTMTTVKLKTLIHTLILSHVCRMARAISRAKSILVELLKKHRHSIHKKNSKYKKNNKVFFGSFRLHYNWGSNSHVLPVPPPGLDRHLYSDSSIWNDSSIITALESESESASLSLSSRALSGYLEWLEEKNYSGGNVNEAAAAEAEAEGDVNEIDRLADAFIANFHEKFRLEKQESYRRYQEMLARSM